jgi:hypothetical protein
VSTTGGSVSTFTRWHQIMVASGGTFKRTFKARQSCVEAML